MAASPSRTDTHALAPLRRPVFAMLWVAWLVANSCALISDMTSAWLMASLTSSPTLVALVQTAAALPILLLSLPVGAVTDGANPRYLLITAHVWVAIVSALLFALQALDMLSAWTLLALVFANGVGLALRGPVMAALLPQIVPRSELGSAIALNTVAMNIARVIGPALAGVLIASFGERWVFALNAVLGLSLAVVLLFWRHDVAPEPLPRERLLSAMRTGLGFVRHSRSLQAVLLKSGLFSGASMALIALLPVLTHRALGEDARIYALLMASMGVGAITAAFGLPRLRARHGPDTLVAAGGLCHAACTLAMALTAQLVVAVPVMVLSGVAWMVVSNSLTTSAQLSLPSWVRARAMSLFQMTIMGCTAAGALLWGQLAERLGVVTSLVVAAACGALGALLLAKRAIRIPEEDELVPGDLGAAPRASPAPHDEQRPVMTEIAYRVVPEHERPFLEVMERTRHSRLRNGAISWHIYREIGRPEHFIEVFVDPTWAAHRLRQHRTTAGDLALRAEREAHHRGPEPPAIRRFVGQPIGSTPHLFQ